MTLMWQLMNGILYNVLRFVTPICPTTVTSLRARWLLNHRCLDYLLNRLFRHSSWIFLILKQLQNSVHECLIEDNSSSFKLMAWQWTDAKPFPEQYHFTYAKLSPGFTVCYHDKKAPRATRTTEVINNCLRDSLLLQSRWQFFIHGYIHCLCRHGVQTLFFMNDTLKGFICYL